MVLNIFLNHKISGSNWTHVYRHSLFSAVLFRALQNCVEYVNQRTWVPVIYNDNKKTQDKEHKKSIAPLETVVLSISKLLQLADVGRGPTDHGTHAHARKIDAQAHTHTHTRKSGKPL